jgi:hypothetical protein
VEIRSRPTIEAVRMTRAGWPFVNGETHAGFFVRQLFTKITQWNISLVVESRNHLKE